jgi:DNA-binding NtrC family response regulator
MFPLFQPPAHSRPAVLFVDDDAVLVRLLAQSLSTEFRVVTAHDGATGLRILEQAGPFAVVIADLKMPGMSGSTFLVEVRSRAPEIVRVLLTGCSHVVGAAEAVKTGQVFRFLTKPYSTEDLLQVVRDAVAQHRLLGAGGEALDLR